MSLKPLLCALVLASVSIGVSRDVTTLNGHTYRSVIVKKVEREGITIIHSEGSAFLSFSTLPPAIHAEFEKAENGVSAARAGTTLPRITEIITLDGKIYRDVIINHVERTGIQITHRDGTAFIDFLNMADDLRRRFGFTEESYKTASIVRKQQQTAADAIRKTEAKRQLMEAQRQLIEAKRQLLLVQASIQTAETSKAEQRLTEMQLKLDQAQAAAETSTLALEALTAAAILAAQEARQASWTAQRSFIATRDYSDRGYTRRDYVGESDTSGTNGGSVVVRGFYRKNGTYVRSYTRSR